MKSIILILSLFSAPAFASSPVIHSDEQVEIKSELKTKKSWVVTVGNEVISLIKDKIKTKAAFLGLNFSLKEKKGLFSTTLEIEAQPAVDQEPELKEFSDFIKKELK